ncbi:maleylacetoacetate isomerase [Curvibacter sp. APW13]|uniref:maleylacetoacetate isomerase n=1 Tax=Curvibacter sp. APW13 TaxID=3077236 RepID=UPI0028E018CA|nr:maleylacetoacetate isomerase [Curvibacter sp. APW13]MDT8992367.1 maleylacetoacetate isomerase [Curvibacter sp. APW13]
MRQLYSYFRSSASYRVRIALHLKGLDFDTVPVHLLRDGGEQHGEAYRAINPAQLVPALVDESLALGQSVAIMEYLEEAYPSPALLPLERASRAQVRAVVQAIACDIHPLNNLRVLQYLEHTLGHDEATRATWYRHWITLGFEALEAQLAQTAGAFCFGDAPTLADCCLIPQVANARRFQTPLERFPTIVRIDAHCRTLPAFIAAAPDNQPDFA